MGGGDQREDDLERRHGAEGESGGPRNGGVAEKADGDGGHELDEDPRGTEQSGLRDRFPELLDDVVRGVPLFCQRPSSDEFPISGDELDGTFGEFRPFRRVFDRSRRGDPDDQPRQHPTGDDEPRGQHPRGPHGSRRHHPDGGEPDNPGNDSGQQPPEDGVLQSVHIGHEPGEEVPTGIPRPGREGLVDAGAQRAEPPQDDLVPGKPFGVPQATTQKSKSPHSGDGHGECGKRRPLGSAKQQPGGGGHERERGQLGSRGEQRGPGEAEEVLCGHCPQPRSGGIVRAVHEVIPRGEK